MGGQTKMSIRDIRDKWMYAWKCWKGRKCRCAPWLELVKSEPAAKTGCGSYSVPLSSFLLMSGFKNAWHNIARHFKLSWEFPFLFCKSKRIQLSFTWNEQNKQVRWPSDKDSLQDSVLINTISKEVNHHVGGGKPTQKVRFIRFYNWSFNKLIS